MPWIMNNDDMKAILYPRRFLSIEALEAYKAGDTIVCLICDKKYRNLAKHITSGHGCDPVEYRIALNIPLKTNLFTEELTNKSVVIAKHRFNELWTEEKRAVFKSGKGNPTGKGRKALSSIAIANIKTASQEAGKRNKGKKHGRTDGICDGCGIKMEISTQRVNRTTKCPACKKLKQSECSLRWQKNNPDKMAVIYARYAEKKKETKE